MPATFGQLLVFTLAELAQQLDVSEAALRRLIADRKLAARRIGRQWFVSEASLTHFFSHCDDSEIPAPAAPQTDLESLISTLKQPSARR